MPPFPQLLAILLLNPAAHAGIWEEVDSYKLEASDGYVYAHPTAFTEFDDGRVALVSLHGKDETADSSVRVFDSEIHEARTSGVFADHEAWGIAALPGGRAIVPLSGTSGEGTDPEMRAGLISSWTDVASMLTIANFEMGMAVSSSAVAVCGNSILVSGQAVSADGEATWLTYESDGVLKNWKLSDFFPLSRSRAKPSGAYCNGDGGAIVIGSVLATDGKKHGHIRIRGSDGNWSTAYEEPEADSRLLSIAGAANGVLLVTGATRPSDGTVESYLSFVLLSRDFGKTWEKRLIEAPRPGTRMLFYSASIDVYGDYWIAGDLFDGTELEGYVMRSINEGVSWKPELHIAEKGVGITVGAVGATSQGELYVGVRKNYPGDGAGVLIRRYVP